MTQPATVLPPPPPQPDNAWTNALPASVSSLTEGVVDFDLAVRVERALCATGYGALRAVKVCVQAGVVLLAGQIPSYHLKQVAQATAQTVLKTHRVRNELEVVPPG